MRPLVFARNYGPFCQRDVSNLDVMGLFATSSPFLLSFIFFFPPRPLSSLSLSHHDCLGLTHMSPSGLPRGMGRHAAGALSVLRAILWSLAHRHHSHLPAEEQPRSSHPSPLLILGSADNLQCSDGPQAADAANLHSRNERRPSRLSPLPFGLPEQLFPQPAFPPSRTPLCCLGRWPSPDPNLPADVGPQIFRPRTHPADVV